MTAATWVFDALPPSMARRGGDPASHVFRHTVGTLVREVIQNANDQALDSPEVHFRFIELEGASLTEFKRAVSWSTLEPHLAAAARTKGGRNLAQSLGDLERTGRLLSLIVEDRHTAGLTGDELHGDSHFRALCKDTLYSHKRSEGAGGSYGLGKSVLWTFSGVSTVLFNSVLSEHARGQQSPRLIGRAELPSHEVGRGKSTRWHSGPGWFGHAVHADAGERAESVWADAGTELARHLGIARTEASGTSILILGFRDPAGDGDSSATALAKEIRDAAVREFWPAIAMPGRPLAIWVATRDSGRPVGDRDLDSVRPFVECYAERDSERESLERPGDVVARPIELTIPARRGGAPPVTASVRLCVRLASENVADPLVGHVALFRGPGMVVRYWDRRNLALGARPFHAVLACGAARAPEAPTEDDLAVDRFLRAAEPPGHDDWEATASLKAEYQRGYAKALDQLKARVNDTLREVTSKKPHHGAEGPDRLRKRFPIGLRGSAGSGPSTFHFAGLHARYEQGCWRFSGTVRPAVESASWSCAIRLVEVGEDGALVRELPIAQVEAHDAKATVAAGVAQLEPEPDTALVSFTGASEPLDDGETEPSTLSLEVVGRAE